MTLAQARAAVGRTVLYRWSRKDEQEFGVITSVNETYVFVRYGSSTPLHGHPAAGPRAAGPASRGGAPMTFAELAAKWRDQPVGRCYVCDKTPPPAVLVAVRRRCTRYLDGPAHTWWVCSAACAFELGQRAGNGALELEHATHPPEAAAAGGGR